MGRYYEKKYSKEKLLSDLKKLHNETKDRITVSDINNCDYTASYCIYYDEIGNIIKLNKLLGEEGKKNINKVYSNKKLLQDLKEVLFAFGDDFTVSFFNSLAIAKYQTYLNRFGDIETAIKKAQELDYKIKKIFI